MGFIKRFTSKRYKKTKGWVAKAIGANFIGSGYIIIRDGLKDIFSFRKTEVEARDFTDVISELELTEHDLQQKVKHYNRLSLAFVTLALLVFISSCILITSITAHAFVNFVLSFLVFLGLAARYSYFSHLIIKKNLQISVSSWFRDLWNG